MMCPALMATNLRLSYDSLLKGAQQPEPAVRPDIIDDLIDRCAFRLGCDLSIKDMLAGGNGYPRYITGEGDVYDEIVDLGMTQERRDLKSLRVWSLSLAECQRDQQLGRNN